MTSFLQVLAAEDHEGRTASRHFVVTATKRVEEQLGSFFKKAQNRDVADELWSYVLSDIRGIAAEAAVDLNYGPSNADLGSLSSILYKHLTAHLEEPFPERTAAVKESRKPKMCPFHRDVVEISLAQGEPQAGFNAMAQHWGGPSHCDNEEYSGASCKFKPQMTTQSYWDEKALKAEERKQERADQAELEAQQPEVTDEVTEEITEPVAETEPVVESESEAEVIELDTDAAELEAEVPMSMAASTKIADEGPVPVMDKRKWTPQTVPQLDVDDDDGPNPTRRKDIVEPIKPDNGSDPDEIGEQRTERQDVLKAVDYEKTEGQGGTWTGDLSAVSATKDELQDVDRNPITALVEDDFDGFVPRAVVQQAIASYKKS